MIDNHLKGPTIQEIHLNSSIFVLSIVQIATNPECIHINAKW